MRSTIIVGALAASTSLVSPASAQDAFFECTGEGRQANVMAVTEVRGINTPPTNTSPQYISNLYSIGASNVANVGVGVRSNFQEMVTIAQTYCDGGPVPSDYPVPEVQASYTTYTTLDF